MNENQLNEGIRLDSEIRCLTQDISRLIKCIQNVINEKDFCVLEECMEINIDGKSCKVIKENLEDFLKKELAITKENKSNLEEKFKNL